MGEHIRKRAATVAHDYSHRFQLLDLRSISEWPLLYWWGIDRIDQYVDSIKIGDVSPAKFGITTGDDVRFTRLPQECCHSNFWKHQSTRDTLAPIVMGAKSYKWIEPLRTVTSWRLNGLQVRVKAEAQYGSESKQIRNQDMYFKTGIAFSMIGRGFAARKHRYPSIIGAKGSSLYPENINGVACSLNSRKLRAIICDLNQGTDFQVGDINRLPLVEDECHSTLYAALDGAFEVSEARREASVEFLCPGPSPWRGVQEWAQQAVDRPEGAPLPEYIEELDPEPPTEHLSFALVVALGRFAPVDDQGKTSTINQRDPSWKVP
jgi:hypothetical protein